MILLASGNTLMAFLELMCKILLLLEPFTFSNSIFYLHDYVMVIMSIYSLNDQTS